MSAAHTPGPWTTYKLGPNPWWVVRPVDRGRQSVADVEPGETVVWNDPKSPSAVAANAHLIAAAPDLLDVLRKDAQTLHELAMALALLGHAQLADACRIASAASQLVIDKAEGRS